MTKSQTQREFAAEIVNKLREAGFEALWAGGCVRDQLLNLRPKDYDIATNAPPEEIRKLFGKRRTLAIGAAFGVIGVLGGRSLEPIEVATFRADGAYVDGRHPIEVVFTNAEHDAQRRDFTINGLFFDPLQETVIDYVGGEQDLQLGIVRAIGEPQARFAEDKLRMLRAIRFATTFDFQIDADTLEAIRQMAPEVAVVSAERIGMELRKMLIHENRAQAVSLLKETGLLRHVMGRLDAMSAEAFSRTLDVLERLVTPSLPLALAALVSGLKDASLGPQIARELRYTNKEGELVQWLLTHVGAIGEAPQLPWPTVQRLLIHPGAEQLVALREAMVGGEDAGSTYCREKLQLSPEVLNPEPLLDGSDLIAQGVKPGPQFARLLEQVRNAQLERRIGGRQEALAYVEELLRSLE